MIYKHKYLTEEYLKNKKIHKVDKSQILLIVISNKFTFLNSLIINCLNAKSIQFQLKQVYQQQLMGYQLPALAFKDYFLTQQNLIEFICDLLLNNENYQNFIQRKQIIKQQYKKWFKLIKQQHQSLQRMNQLKQIGINSEQDYFNHVFSQYFSIASWIKGDILQRKYQNYKRNQINLETLFAYDLVTSILNLCEKTSVEYILRSHFENLLQWKEDFEKKLINLVNQKKINQQVSIEIVIQKTDQQQTQLYQKFKSNHKRFAIIFTVMLGVYFKWVS